jgi:hypothetical protein
LKKLKKFVFLCFFDFVLSGARRQILKFGAWYEFFIWIPTGLNIVAPAETPIHPVSRSTVLENF